MTSAWIGLETLTAWSDDMRLSFDSKGRRVLCTFTFINIDEFFLWKDYNKDSYLEYSYTRRLDGLVEVVLDLVYFIEQRQKYGLRTSSKDCE